jgi:hypothetical protein
MAPGMAPESLPAERCPARGRTVLISGMDRPAHAGPESPEAFGSGPHSEAATESRLAQEWEAAGVEAVLPRAEAMASVRRSGLEWETESASPEPVSASELQSAMASEWE